MSELHRGKLKVTQKKTRQIVQVDFNGTLFSPAAGQLSTELTPTDGLEVEFERVVGQPREIREAGKDFVPPRSTGQSRQSGKHSKSSHGGQERTRQNQSESQQDVNRDFHNPYNFIPAPPRNIEHPDLGDHNAAQLVQQDTFHLDRYTGRIRVRMAVKTPLLIPETTEGMYQQNDNGHKTNSLRVDASGLPAIASSSIRGMLRSAYEAVTNSRFGRFAKEHQNRLEYRESSRPFRKIGYSTSPWDLLPESLRPATTIDELSPADRVFGWVRTDSTGNDSNSDTQADAIARRGLLRVGPVRCETLMEESVESFDPPGVPLAILAAPKPQQGRFYVAASPKGEAQDDGLSKVEAGYTSDKGLRGRKAYPHHSNLPDGYWENPTDDRTQESVSDHYQEYRRPRDNGAEQRDDQNRSILGWVKPGAEFAFDVHVENLSAVELGALFWLVSLPDKHYFRLGAGKPLGFGSVRFSMDHCDVLIGEQLKQRYSSWNDRESDSDPRELAIQAFQRAVGEAYSPEEGKEFEKVCFIAAFLVASKGFDDKLPVHYPRATANDAPGPPSPAGESFKWFVKNEKQDAQYALPDLKSEKGLPTLQDARSSGQ